ncbi:hypothetical protein GW17_00037056 [Ensete ventricosum]|nr:hypothetical protein GW17_00037056 [Ensete ventricosum]
MQVTTVKINNNSSAVSVKDMEEFFSFSGHIEYIEMQRESEMSQLAYVTFKDSQGADAALLLSGSTIVDSSVTISGVENYQLPPEACRRTLVTLSYYPNFVCFRLVFA